MSNPNKVLHHHVPPGGVDSISFADQYSSLEAYNKTQKEMQQKPEVAVTPLEPVEAPVRDYKKVHVIIAGSVEVDKLVKDLSESLKKSSILDAQFARVNDVALLPYYVQKFAKNASVVIAAAVLANQVIGIKSLQSPLTNTLYDVGLRAGTPVIPLILNFDNLLELRAFMKERAAASVKAAKDVLDLSASETVVFESTVDHDQGNSNVFESALDTLNVDALLGRFRKSLQEHGASGIFGLGRKFRIIDDDRSGQLTFDEFSKAIAEHVLQWSSAQIRAVFDYFDKDKSGSISFDEFLVGVRGIPNERRQQIIMQAFAVLDSDKSGIIDMTDIKAKYDASQHPDVKSGKRTADEVLREFLDTFDSEEKDGKVSPSEFIQYYSNVSASIDNDDYFELMIRNAWHISGGVGWAANSSCRRVLVTHSDGHQTVEEIKNDLGIQANDVEAMKANLLQQGIKDVVGIELFGSMKSMRNPKPSSTSANATSSASAASSAPTAPTATSTANQTMGSPSRPAAGGKPNSNVFVFEERPATAASRRRPPGGQSSIHFG